MEKFYAKEDGIYIVLINFLNDFTNCYYNFIRSIHFKLTTFVNLHAK